MLYPIQLFADWLNYSVFGVSKEALLALGEGSGEIFQER